ncbi:MAG: tyrosine-type recombinase/integrase [Actinomycetota bacterium]|nr:tyrosine-type recombinase/integrase [Actinomycetota bacterium]
MTTRSRRTEQGVLDAEAVVARYGESLAGQPLAERSRGAYLAQVRSYVGWLASSGRGPAALCEPRVRDSAVRDYKRHVKATLRWAPTSVNQALAAIDNFYRSLNQGRPEVAREDLPQLAPRALDEAQQRAFLRAVERCPSARDRATATVFLYTALRLSELAALDLADVSMSARRGRLKVRFGKGDAFREVPLNSATRAAVEEWLTARADQVARSQRACDAQALWLARTGGRLSRRAIDMVVRTLARDAGLDASAHLLRHTCVTNLVRSGTDVVLVAELAGHRRLDTTRRYSLPSEADRDAAVEALLGP